MQKERNGGVGPIFTCYFCTFATIVLKHASLQPTDDIVLMAQSLEKAFLQKVAQMPQDELELAPPPLRSKPGKPGKKGRGNAGEHGLLFNVQFIFMHSLSMNGSFLFSSSVSGGVTTAHQVPAVSQSAYSPPTPETPDSILSTPPQTIVTKSLPPTLQTEQSIPSITSLPPTQPTAKVTLHIRAL